MCFSAAEPGEDFSADFISQGKAISILLPSRGRPALLKSVLKNIAETCEYASLVEILVRLDDDDSDTLAVRDQFAAICVPVDLKIITAPQGGGYRQLHLFYDELSAIARGDFLMLFSDDASFKSKGWEREFFRRRNRLAVLRFPFSPNPGGKPENPFPAVHRKIFQITGHFEGDSVDLWLEYVSRRTGLEEYVPEVDLFHYHRQLGGAGDRRIRRIRPLVPRFQTVPRPRCRTATALYRTPWKRIKNN